MRKYKKVLKDELEDVVCDVCGKSCVSGTLEAFGVGAEFAVLRADWGYGSRKDGESFMLEMCEDCFDKIVAFVGTISEKSALD